MPVPTTCPGVYIQEIATRVCPIVGFCTSVTALSIYLRRTRSIQTPRSRSLKARLSRDATQKVRHIRHSQEYWLSEENSARLAANQYLHDIAETLQLPHNQLRGTHKKAQHFFSREHGVEYQFDEEKHCSDAGLEGRQA